MWRFQIRVETNERKISASELTRRHPRGWSKSLAYMSDYFDCVPIYVLNLPFYIR